MEDKFEKSSHCQYCNKPMEAEYRNKKFCSDKCRVYFNRENKVKKVSVSDFTKPANVVKPITEKPQTSNFTINTKKRLTKEERCPGIKEGESVLDYKIRMEEK